MSDEVEWSGDVSELSDTQREIMELAVMNPEMSNAEIAAEVDCSESWVRETRNRYEDQIEVREESDSSGSIIWLLLLLLLVAFAAQEAGVI